ncbi:transposase, partial [Deinococcus rhizophilus]|uniref:transposase n=1 Tax=Deinococcus rhizophilus TaxID=3049544 RepID=UPI003898D86D
MDATVVRAHHHAAGARQGQVTQALGRSRGGFSTKIHLKCEGGGKPLALYLTGGERHEMVGFRPLLDGGKVKRGGPGRPRQRPRKLVGDRGYSNGVARKELRRRGMVVLQEILQAALRDFA